MSIATPKVLVAGGATSLVYGNFGRKLEEAGVEVGWHVGSSDRSRTTTLDHIPPNCEGVIIIKDMTGHALSNTAKAAAKAANVPCAMVTRKWSDAAPILRATGIILPLPTTDSTAPVDTHIVNLGREYVCMQRENGRNPKQEEINSVLKRAYGPDFELTETQFKMIMKAAVERVPLIAPPPLVTQEEVDALLDTPVVKDPPARSEVQLAASMMLGVSPLIAKGLHKAEENDLVALVQSVVDFGVWELTPEIDQIVREVVTSQQTPSAVSTEPLSKVERGKPIRAWLVTIWKEVQAGTRPYFTEKTIRSEGLAKFGMLTGDFWCLVRDARAEVYGAWATHLDASPAYYRDRSFGRTTMSFEEAVVAGLPCVRENNYAHTSRIAVNEFLDRVAPVSVVTAPPAPQVVEPQENNEMEKQIKDQFDALFAQNKDLKAQNEELSKALLQVVSTVQTVRDMVVMVQKHGVENFNGLFEALKAVAANNASKAAPADGLLALVQAGQIRLVVEPATK